jgi:16S rRNA (cytidine1402-2'-O)-methyltransferase
LSSLILVTLPIGNKEDITLRALEVLKSKSVFYAEDTRVFKEHLKSFEIQYSNKEIDSFHDHSEDKIGRIISRIINGEDIVLVSDAGSPVISDPAYPLIKKAIENKIEIKSCPGVTSVITALELSGLSSNPFHYWGFLGRTKGDKKSFFKSLELIAGTHIFFESPHRMIESLEIYFDVFPDKEIILARELTKKFEEVVRLNKEKFLKEKSSLVIKGEFVALFNQEYASNERVSDDIKFEVNEFLDKGGNTKKLAKIFAKILDRDTREIYSQMIHKKEIE